MTVNMLQDTRNFELKGASNKPAGRINFQEFNKIERPSFTECLRGGWQLNFAVAIDFTASNR